MYVDVVDANVEAGFLGEEDLDDGVDGGKVG